MSIIDTVRAGTIVSDPIIPTLEFTCSAWPDAIYLCAGYENRVFIDETGRSLPFEAAPMDLALPRRGADVNETITIAVDNVRGVAQQRVDMAKEAQATIRVTVRLYLDSDPTFPAENPFTMDVLSATLEAATVQLSCGYFDLTNTAWPRDRYTLAFAPGIAYL